MRANGEMTSSMAKGWKNGKKAHNTREPIQWARKRASESTPGLMAPSMKEIGLIIELVVTELTTGRMAGSIQERGRIMKCKAMEFTCGETADATKDNITTIRRVDLGFTTGLMADRTRAGGIRASSTGWAPTSTHPRAK